ncbi:hypothetical protein PHMEG_00013449 [Phytophthora megakarya]|uniref:Uncharacterized protein n=1 Tax=Phytophthora megakarya TaxID=4795 RepID=A0A225W685_9STRA|nr:hypothetical protein PHMEG_00013449 [Phytophthora megakarya]
MQQHWPKSNVQSSATVALGVPQAPGTAGLLPRSNNVAGKHENSAEERADVSESDSASVSGGDHLTASGGKARTLY